MQLKKLVIGFEGKYGKGEYPSSSKIWSVKIWRKVFQAYQKHNIKDKWGYRGWSDALRGIGKIYILPWEEKRHRRLSQRLRPYQKALNAGKLVQGFSPERMRGALSKILLSLFAHEERIVLRISKELRLTRALDTEQLLRDIKIIKEWLERESRVLMYFETRFGVAPDTQYQALMPKALGLSQRVDEWESLALLGYNPILITVKQRQEANRILRYLMEGDGGYPGRVKNLRLEDRLRQWKTESRGRITTLLKTIKEIILEIPGLTVNQAMLKVAEIKRMLKAIRDSGYLRFAPEFIKEVRAYERALRRFNGDSQSDYLRKNIELWLENIDRSLKGNDRGLNRVRLREIFNEGIQFQTLINTDSELIKALGNGSIFSKHLKKIINSSGDFIKNNGFPGAVKAALRIIKVISPTPKNLKRGASALSPEQQASSSAASSLVGRASSPAARVVKQRKHILRVGPDSFKLRPSGDFNNATMYITTQEGEEVGFIYGLTKPDLNGEKERFGIRGIFLRSEYRKKWLSVLFIRKFMEFFPTDWLHENIIPTLGIIMNKEFAFQPVAPQAVPD